VEHIGLGKKISHIPLSGLINWTTTLLYQVARMWSMSDNVNNLFMYAIPPLFVQGCKDVRWYITWFWIFDERRNLLPDIFQWFELKLFHKKKKHTFGSFWGEKGKKCVFEVWNCWNVGLKKEWITMWVNSRWLLMWVKSRWFYLGLFSEVWVAMRKIVWKKSNFQYYIWQHRYMCFSSWIGKHEGHISLGLKRI